MRALLVPIVMLVLGSSANAGGFVRAAPHEPAIALATWDEHDILSSTIDLALDGLHFQRAVHLEARQLLDMQVLDDGTLLVFAIDSKRGSNVVIRVAGGKVTETTISLSPLSRGENLAGVASNGREVVLIGQSGVLRSWDGGRTFARLGTWPADVDEFERLSAWLSSDGALDVLALGYNTCGSTDRLESIQRLHMAPDGMASRASLDFETLADPADAYLARYGIVFSSKGDYSSEGDGRLRCKLRMHANHRVRTVDRQNHGFCDVYGRDNGRFTLIVFGDHIFRVGGAAPVLLAMPAEPVESFYPDHRGRALVLLKDGRLIRCGRRTPPVTLRSPQDKSQAPSPRDKSRAPSPGE
jgi:hypothetical protein